MSRVCPNCAGERVRRPQREPGHTKAGRLDFHVFGVQRDQAPPTAAFGTHPGERSPTGRRGCGPATSASC